MALIDFLTGAGKLDGNATTGGVFAHIKDSLGEYLTKTNRGALPETGEGIPMMGKNDDMAVFMRTDRKGNQIIGNFITELIETFEGAVVNVQKWTTTSTTFVAAQATLTGYNFNSTNVTTLNAVGILLSQRLFAKNQRVPLQMKTRLRHSMVAGTLADMGFGVPATTTTIVPNGACFRFTNSGVVKGVITFNNAEIAISNVVSQVASNGNTVGGNLNMSAAYYTAGYFVYDLIIDDDNAIFTIQDTNTGELIGKLSLPVPTTAVKMWGATALPIYTRVWNNVAPSTAPIMLLTDLIVLSTDWALNPTVQQLAGSLRLSQGVNPFTGAQLANHTNSTAPTSATLANATAGYTTLGGKWQFAAVAGAVTDYALFGFTVPAGSRFLCEGIRIESYNTVVPVATTPTVLEWAMGFNSSAVSLATANIARLTLGVQSLPNGAVAGTPATPIDITFTTPEVVESGRFVHVILTMPIASATATQIVRGTCFIRGRFI